MKNTKRYWLRGLVWGILIYILGIAIVYVTDKGEMAGFATMIVVIYFSPIIILFWSIGYLRGKIKNRNKSI